MKKRPNLIYVFADQWRAHAMGFMKEDQVKTPHIDAFSKESKVLTNVISTYPLCSPHRASLMTGKYPYSCGMWTNCKIGLDEVLMLMPQETCIGNVLKDNGYSTGYIGKWHLDAAEMNFTPEPISGAKGWGAYTPPGERRQGFDYWLSYGAMNQHMEPYYWGDTDEKIEPKKWSVEFETDAAINFIKRQETEKPFALFLSYNPPHSPYDEVPERYKAMYTEMAINFRPNVPDDLKSEKDQEMLRNYFAAVTGIDENFGRLLDYLKEKEMDEDTIVVLSSDHGDMLNSHRFNGKNVWYEESINIPFIIRWKNHIETGLSDGLMASPDHMPTLLDLLNIEIPSSCEGKSLATLIKEGTMENEPKDALICMIPGLPALIEPFKKRGLNHKCFGWRGVRTKRYTYVVYNGLHPDDKQRRFLYDNVKDPYQMQPVEIDEIFDNLHKGRSFSNPYLAHMNGDVAINSLAKLLEERLKNYLGITNDPFILKFPN
ncbi:sulfatase family protein [Vallitalea okinawensis]|uniref:sulfatase family protein n=1 Tax=Vallitalea okinawensis TaxID=2078660 RepID=UPI000CFDF28E|nr:sulfatase [Vallitalea okinawensis]